MSASETHGVVLSVNSNVLLVATLKLLNGSLNVLHTTWLAHLLAGEVAMKTGSVPVTWDWLGMERDLGTEFLGNAVEKETSKPEVVAQLNTIARTNLEFPLSWHNLGIGTGDLYTSE